MENIKKVNDNLYELKINDITVQMSYSKRKKSLEECLINILKQKI